MVSPPIMVAIDTTDRESALELAIATKESVGAFKIGLGLLHGPGPDLIGELAELGRPVFADAKLHDIPTQVERAARALGSAGARWVTVHASGGHEMVGAAVAVLFLALGLERVAAPARRAYAFRPLLIPGIVVLWPLVLVRWVALERGGR